VSRDEPTTGPGLGPSVVGELDAILRAGDLEHDRLFPGDRPDRQPVHSVYVPADRAGARTVRDWGAQALAALEEHAPHAATLAAATGLDGALVDRVYPRVLAKLARQPIEDLRIDLEDGYGARDDATEDRDAVAAGAALAAIASSEGAPVMLGVRAKGLEPSTRSRGVRTLDLVLGSALDAAGGAGLPAGWVVTLPKVSRVAQVEAMVLLCERLEAAHGVPAGRLRFELQIETPQAVLGPDGAATLARMVHAAGGRCVGLHFGTYDFAAALGVAAAEQSLDHPLADHAKSVMLLATAGTGVRGSDGSTNVLPVGGGAGVHAAWALHVRLIRRSLARALYQGWDLHPAQLPTRFLATYAFYVQALPAAAERLRAYVGGGAGTGVLDEPATAQALAGVIVRALDCGAVDVEEATRLTGLDRSVLDSLARRRIG